MIPMCNIIGIKVSCLPNHYLAIFFGKCLVELRAQTALLLLLFWIITLHLVMVFATHQHKSALCGHVPLLLGSVLWLSWEESGNAGVLGLILGWPLEKGKATPQYSA